MLTVLLLALCPQTTVADAVVVVRPGQVVEVPLAANVASSDTLHGSIQFLEGSGCSLLIENLTGDPVPPSAWSYNVLMNVELRSTPLGWRDGGAVVGGLGYHDGIPTPPPLAGYDGTLDYAGSSGYTRVYDMQTQPIDAVNGAASWALAGRESVYVACWQWWSLNHDWPAWNGYGHGAGVRYRNVPGGVRARVRLWKD